MTPDDLDLKRATAEMIKGVGGLEAGASFCRVGKSVLGDNQSINRPDSFVAIDVVADLEPLSRERSGWPHVTRALCRRMGGTFVPVCDVPADAAAVMSLLGKLSLEMGQATQAACAALHDLKVEPREAATVARELDDVIHAAACLRALLQSIAGETA